MAGPTVDVFVGTTVAFATSTFASELVDMAWDWSRPEVEVTHQGSTSAMEFVGADLYDPGTLTLTCHFNADTDVPAYGGAVEVITITWPSTGTSVVSGVITGYSGTYTLNEKMVQDVVVKLSGAIAITAA